LKTRRQFQKIKNGVFTAFRNGFAVGNAAFSIEFQPDFRARNGRKKRVGVAGI
jgi:hypothetical protein